MRVVERDGFDVGPVLLLAAEVAGGGPLAYGVRRSPGDADDGELAAIFAVADGWLHERVVDGRDRGEIGFRGRGGRAVRPGRPRPRPHAGGRAPRGALAP